MSSAQVNISQSDIRVLDGDRGANYPKKEEFTTAGHCLFLDASNVTKNGFSFEQRQFISKDRDEKLRGGKLQRGDIVLTTRGTIGNFAYYSSDIPFDNVRINSGMLILRNGTEFNTSYLYQLLKSDYVSSQIKNITTGSSQPQITRAIVNEITLLKPSIDQQQKIAAVLSVLDEKIELNRKINAELEQMARTLYDYWFVQFDFPGFDGKPYKSSGGKMFYNDQLKRNIPAGWQALKLQDVLEFEKGTEPGADAYSDVNNDEYDLPFYRVGNIDGETDTYIDSSKFNTKIAKSSDVIVTFDGSVGKMGLGLNGAISGGLRHIYDKTGKISDAAVYAIFGNEYITKTIERYATGSVILHASSSIPYLAIPYDEQTFAVFQEIVEPMFAKIIANRQQSQKLAHLRDWLLPMLMNGQVKVL